MPTETLVLCGDVPRSRHGRGHVLQLDASPDSIPERRIVVHWEALTRQLCDNVPDVLADAFEIAAYIFAADRLTKRGTGFMANMGAHWRRKFRFKIAVRCPTIWKRPDVEAALTDTLEFLSEDSFAFEFFQTARRTGVQPYLGFSDPQAHVINPDDVMLFSGGLDSTAGLVEQLIGDRKRVALVTHRSARLLVARQTELIGRLREKISKRSLFHVPMWVTLGGHEAVEFSQRTRSLLFAVLGMLVAWMFNKRKIFFFENGITSVNLPIAEHVLGARASRTTHPRVFRGFERLFSLLLETNVEISNPFFWKTKKDVVDILSSYGWADLIADTVSCANVRQLPMTSKQCGVCIQCIERRFAILAAGLGEYDPPDGYAVDLFRGEHKDVEDITMAECHVLRAQKLASMSKLAFSAAYGQVFRIPSSLSGSASDNLIRIFELHRRYGRYVIEVVDHELKSSATLREALELPPTSLLAMINAPVAFQPAYLDPIEREPAPSLQASLDHEPKTHRPIIFAVDADARKILFEQGPELKGVAYELVATLAEQLRSDKQKGVKKFAFIRTAKLLELLQIDNVILRQRVHSTRLSLRQQFLDRADYDLDIQDIIQSDRWKGYRLNPYLLLVDAVDLRGAIDAADDLTTSS
jgi:Queuosine biosynthesis protein QueC